MKVIISLKGFANTKVYRAYMKIYKTPSELVYRDWFVSDGFSNFLKDVGPCPSKEHSLLKFNEDDIWKPSNCSWQPQMKRINHKSVIDFIFNLKTGFNSAGVYKLTFDNGMFYIGSTKCFRTRAQGYKSSFNRGYIHNKRMKECVRSCKSVLFEVLEESINYDEAIKREGRYLISHIGNPNLLNRSFDATSNKGIKWTTEEIEKSILNGKGTRGKRGRGKGTKNKPKVLI